MIYLIESDNYYKVGYTKNWKQREKLYKTCNPNFKLVDFRDGNHFIESKIHKLLNPYLYKSEWFNKCEDVVNVWENYFKSTEYSQDMTYIKTKESEKFKSPLNYFGLNVITLPNKMTEGTSLNTKDLLVYLALKSFNNARNQCYPSLNTIAKKLGTSINTVSKCIDNLIKEGYVSREPSGRGFNYIFTEANDFELFTHNFIERTDYTFKEKAYLAGMLQYMIIDSDDLCKSIYTNKELADLLNTSHDTISRIDKKLQTKNALTIINPYICNYTSRGCRREKIFFLENFGQELVYTFKANKR